MKKRFSFAVVAALLLLVSVAPRPVQAAVTLTRMVVGCKTFLVTGASYIIANGSQFNVQVIDSLGRAVYSRDGNVLPGRYGGYGGPFQGQPAQGPVHALIRLNGEVIADLTAIYPSPDSCGMFNWRPDAMFDDSRLNLADPWETVAIYCYGDGTLSVLRPRYQGDLASPEVVHLTQRMLAHYPERPAQNILLQDKSGVQLYLLTSGELEVVATTKEPDKLYKFVLGGC